MSVQLLVRDRNGKPMQNVKVFIKWKDGTSTIYTDNSGNAVIDTNGYIVYTDVYGDKYYQEIYTKDINVLKHQVR